MLWALISANIIDIGHIYFRIIGLVPWWSSACPQLGAQCSFNFYPFHNLITLTIALALSLCVFSKDKRIKFLGFFGLGIILHLALDAIHLFIGFGI